MKKIILAVGIDFTDVQYASLLDRKVFQVFVAKSAEEALQIHNKEHVDLIVADIDMPVMGGDKLCQIVKSHNAEHYVYVSLVCSGKKADLKRCEQCNADSYLSRPPEIRAVAEKICRILDTSLRVDPRILIKCDVESSYSDEPFYCVSRDLSVSGILFEADKALAKGDRVNLSFYLPGGARISVSGQVVRVRACTGRKYAYGIEFRDLSSESRDEIKAFVDSRHPAST